MATTKTPRALALAFVLLNLTVLVASTTDAGAGAIGPENLQTPPSESPARRLRLEDCNGLPNDPYGIAHVPFIYGPGWILAWVFLLFNILIQAFYTNESVSPDAILTALYPLLVSLDAIRQIFFSMSSLAVEEAKAHYARLAISLFILSANWNFVGVWSAGYMLIKLVTPEFLPDRIKRLSRWPAAYVYGQLVMNAIVALACGLIAWVFAGFDGLKVTELQVFGLLPQMTVWAFGVCLIFLYTPYFDEERVFGRDDSEDDEFDDEVAPKRSLIGSIIFGFFRFVHIILYFLVYIISWLTSAITFCAPILFLLCLPILISSYTTSPLFTPMQLIPAGLGFVVLSHRLQRVCFWRFLLGKILLMLGDLFATMGWSRYDRVEMREVV